MLPLRLVPAYLRKLQHTFFPDHRVIRIKWMNEDDLDYRQKFMDTIPIKQISCAPTRKIMQGLHVVIVIA